MTLQKNNKCPNFSDELILQLSADVLTGIITKVGMRSAESGGAIGGKEDEILITCFHFDESSRNSGVTYSPDYQALNSLFKTEWNPRDIRLKGFIHSHPGRYNRPSTGDEVYAERILKAIDDLDYLWLPIVNTIPDTGEFVLTPWVAFAEKSGVQIVRGHVTITGNHKPIMALAKSHGLEVNQESLLSLHGNSYANAIEFTKPQSNSIATTSYRQTADRQSEVSEKLTKGVAHLTGKTFDRVQEAYDLNIMENSRVMAVGTGGAASWLEELARAGLGQFILIDPDTISETNLATQQTYRRDIGRPKVDCIAERIRDINPTAKVIALQKQLEDIDMEEFTRFALKSLDGRETKRTILCGLTDNFSAQARINRLALHFALPSLCAQVYREGRGAEITFTFPGVTPACHRCILSSRYKYYIEQGNENDVTSHGTPIFATTRLNAIKGFIILAMLHHGSSHPRWGNMLSRIGNRNMVLIRMDPDISESIGVRHFDRVFEKGDKSRLFFDDVVWLPEKQESPDTGYDVPCPDCGGTGDLRDAIGKVNITIPFVVPILEKVVEKIPIKEKQPRINITG